MNDLLSTLQEACVDVLVDTTRQGSKNGHAELQREAWLDNEGINYTSLSSISFCSLTLIFWQCSPSLFHAEHQ